MRSPYENRQNTKESLPTVDFLLQELSAQEGIFAVLSPKEAGIILSKLESLSEEERVDRFLQDGVSPKIRPLLSAPALSEKLLTRKFFLLQQLSKTLSEHPDQSESAVDFFRSLETETEIFKITFRSVAQSGTPFEFSDFTDTELDTNVSFSQDPRSGDIDSMRTLYKETLSESPKAVQENLLREFDLRILDPNSHFSLFRHKGKIRGLLCFSQIPSESERTAKFSSAFSVHPDYQGGLIGWIMVEKSFDRKKEILFADCVPQKPTTSQHIEHGFIGYRLWDDTGESVMDIVLDTRLNAGFKTKSFSREEILALPEDANILLRFSKDTREIDFAPCDAGFVLTRYFFDETRAQWCAVFEKTDILFPKKHKKHRSLPRLFIQSVEQKGVHLKYMRILDKHADRPFGKQCQIRNFSVINLHRYPKRNPFFWNKPNVGHKTFFPFIEIPSKSSVRHQKFFHYLQSFPFSHILRILLLYVFFHGFDIHI